LTALQQGVYDAHSSEETSKLLGLQRSETVKLTIGHIEALMFNPARGGFGYLGCREYMTGKQKAYGDRQLVKFANANGWDMSDLFYWADSKAGRWFGDAIVGGGKPTVQVD
jgi:hypothetical protein